MLIQRLILSRAAKAWRNAPGAAVPTVCVGNITVGGTGKTPHTELILSLLQESDRWGGASLAVLSRGYKRKSKGFQIVRRDSTAAFAGDEPLQIARKFPTVTVAVDKNRVEGCAKLVAGADSLVASASTPSAAADLIVLDDAFQYKRLHASLNIVLVDWSRPIFDDRLLPFGRLRDLPKRLFEADIVIVTKCPGGIEEQEKAAFAEKLRLHGYDAAVCSALTPSGRSLTLLFSQMEYCPLEPVFQEADARYGYSKTAVTITGIANDAPMKAWLSDTYKLVAGLSYPDHHRFSRGDMREMATAVRKFPTAAFVTTEKDAQRLRDCRDLPSGMKERLFALPIKVGFASERELEVLRGALDGLRESK